jgi:hypothetical protein
LSFPAPELSVDSNDVGFVELFGDFPAEKLGFFGGMRNNLLMHYDENIKKIAPNPR